MAAVAKEIFQVLQRFNYTVSLYDDDLNAVAEPAEARKFFAGVQDPKSRHPKPHLLVSLKDDDDDSSIQLLFGKSVHANAINGLMQTARVTATKYNMTFDPQQYFKEINPKDTGLVAESKTRGYDMQVCEGMYGTSKSSYLKFENAKMIVRHKTRIDDSRIGARGRYVEAIFVENASGERLKFPTNDLSAARAMTQHVSSGGDFRDSLGEQIVTLAEEYGRLGTCSRYVQANGATLQEGAMAVREACRTKMLELRKTFQRLYRPTSYAQEAAEMMDRAHVLTETGTAIDEGRIDELRRLLNDADLPDAVYETAARAVLAGQPVAPVTERMIGRAGDQSHLAENNPIIRSHMDWLDQFDPDRLVEFTMGSTDTSYEDNYDAATQAVIEDFDASAFVHSPAMQDVLDGRDPDDAEENILDEEEIVDALQDYLRTVSDVNDLGGDLLGVAEQLLDPACEALRDMGYEIEPREDDPLDEPSEDDPLFAEPALDDTELTDDIETPMVEDDGELTREDILLPPSSPQKSKSLFQQVGKSARRTANGYEPVEADDIAKSLSAGARGIL